MSDTTSTKRAEEVALLHETRSRFAGSEKEKTFDLATAAFLRALAAERDALQMALKNIAAKAADEIEKLRAERDALLNKLNERDALHTQDLLAIQAWRKANPDNTVWPQKERLVSWLLDEMTALRAALGEKK